MTRTISLFMAVAAIAVAPAIAAASPPTTPHSPTGNGGGYDHMNSPQATTGQPSQDCEALIASGTGSDPGNSAANGSSAFGGSAGDVYAGSQPVNSRNTASVSQYDVACAMQPQ